MSAALPIGAPASTHLTTVAISASVSEMSFFISWMPTFLSRVQGGISRFDTLFFIDLAQGRASS